METIRTIYIGDLRTEATHVRSGKILITDAPTDNQGKGESFSPTRILRAASLGSCMATIMGIASRNHKIEIDGTRIRITKLMASNPRKVAEIQIEFDMPANEYSEKEKSILDHAARQPARLH